MISFEKFLETNTLNFIIMVAILAWIYKKANLDKFIANMAQKTKNTVEASINNSNEAILKLINVQRDEKNISTKTKKIITRAKKSARAVKEKNEIQTKEAIKNVNRSIKKSIAAQIQKTKTSLEKDVAKASLTAAQGHILQMLDHNLHRQYIEDSIDNLDEVKF